MNHANPSRRKLIESLTLAAVALATLPVRRAARAAAPAAVSPPTPPGHANAAAAAPGLPHLTEDDPAAQTLAYVEDAARAGKIPGFVAGSRCDNCLQLQGGAGDPFRPCPLFPGKLVSAAGWCKSWTPEI
jgi:hypothetical protein